MTKQANEQPGGVFGRHLSRRGFLGGTGGLAAAAVVGPAWLPQIAMAGGSGGGNNVLVKIFLRGGHDGLTTVVPYADGDLYNARPTIAVQPPGATDGALDLDGFFGLAPAAAPLLTPWSAGDLAVVHACGSPNESRSHFDAQQFMESGAPLDPESYASGWIARMFDTLESSATLRGVGVDSILPRSMNQAERCLPIPSAKDFTFPGNPLTAAERRAAIAAMYTGFGPPMEAAAELSFESIDVLEVIDFANYAPEPGATYPNTQFGQSLKSAAALIKADVGVEVITANLGRWDLHNQLGPIDGVMANNLDELTSTLEAFYLDTLPVGSRVVVAVGSEFGRRVAQNGSQGVDHGRATAWLVMGTSVVGGQVYGTWPGLAPANLINGDLPVTTDYRDVLFEITGKHLGATDESIFPGLAHLPLGLLP